VQFNVRFDCRDETSAGVRRGHGAVCGRPGARAGISVEGGSRAVERVFRTTTRDSGIISRRLSRGNPPDQEGSCREVALAFPPCPPNPPRVPPRVLPHGPHPVLQMSPGKHVSRDKQAVPAPPSKVVHSHSRALRSRGPFPGTGCGLPRVNAPRSPSLTSARTAPPTASKPPFVDE